MKQHSPYPIKVSVFTSGMMSLPCIISLYEQKRLAGVVLGSHLAPKDPHFGMSFDPQFIGELNRLGIPYVAYDMEQLSPLCEQLMLWEANVGLMLGFPKKISGALLNCFSAGFYNLHASALPDYHGAMPLYWQIRNQETSTMLTAHKVTAEWDGGEIVLQDSVPIDPRDTLYSLTASISDASVGLLQQLLNEIELNQGIPKGIAQTGEGRHAPWPTAQDNKVDWNAMTSLQIAALARAGNAAMAAMIAVNEKPINLLQASAVNFNTFSTPPGTIVYIGEPEGLIVATIDGALRLDILSTVEGIFSGIAFAERFLLDAGNRFDWKIV